MPMNIYIYIYIYIWNNYENYIKNKIELIWKMPYLIHKNKYAGVKTESPPKVASKEIIDAGKK